MLAKLLFSSELNETYKDIANIYHKYWSETDNVKRIFRTPITTCSVCSTYNSNAVSVLGLYFDAMPYHSVTVLDAAVLTIMTILHKDQLLSDNEAAMHIISTLDPDTIKNHYFINVCGQRERVTNDLDVVEFLKKILFGIKTKTTNIRDYANLTKLLKKECIGDCNTFLNQNQLVNIEKQHRNAGPKFFIKQQSYTNSSIKQNNTSNRFQIACDIIGIKLSV
jgi:hypothetical protein